MNAPRRSHQRSTCPAGQTCSPFVHRVTALAALLTTTMLAHATCSAVEVQLHRSGAATITGTLVAIDDTSIDVTTDDTTHRVPVSNVLSVSRLDEAPLSPPSMGRALVETSDGSRLAMRRFGVTDGRVDGQMLDGATVDMPVERVTSVLLAPLTAEQQPRWDEWVKTPAMDDTLVVRRKTQLDFVQLTVGDVNEQHIKCTLDGESLDATRTKVVGIIYARRVMAAAQPAPVGVLDFNDGSQIMAATVSLSDDLFSVTTPDGLELEYPSDRFISLDASAGKIARLVDFKPLLVEYAPYYPLPKSAQLVKQFVEPRFLSDDASAAISLDGVHYDSGIVARSRTRLRYAVPNGFARFNAVVGFIDHVRPQGLVHFRVSGDDRVLYDEIIRGDTPAQQIAVDLADARQLSIEIDYGSDDDTADIISICEAHFER